MKIYKKMMKIFLSAIVIIAILGSIFTVKAVTGSMSFSVTPNKVKPGENFTIILKVQASADLVGIVGTFDYDDEKIELVKRTLVDPETEEWLNLSGAGNKELVAGANVTGIRSCDLFKLVFKVKNTVSAGETVSVLFNELKFNTTENKKGEFINVEDQTVTVNVVENTATPTPTPTSSVTPTPTNTPTGSSSVTPTPTNTPTGSSSVTPTPTNAPTGSSSVTPTGGNTSTITPSGNKNNNGREVVVYTDDDNTTNTTSKNAAANTAKSSTSTLPYTGMSSFIVIGIVLVAIASVGLYFVYGRYRGI